MDHPPPHFHVVMADRRDNLVEIDTVDGTGCLVQAYAADQFSGAGVTTLAPIQPPTPK